MAKKSNVPATRVVNCQCVQPTQDHWYGVGKRAANLAKSKSPSIASYRCTVCAKIHDFEITVTLASQVSLPKQAEA